MIPRPCDLTPSLINERRKDMRVLKLHVLYKNIVIYKWFSLEKKTSGYAVIDHDEYVYFQNERSCKEYVDKRLA